MDFIRPFFEGKNRFTQTLFLLLFVVAGAIVFTALGQLIVSGIYHTTNMYEASSPSSYVRITQTFGSVGMFLIPALMFAYCQDKKWFNYNDANRKPHHLLVNATLVLSIVVLPLVAILSQWNEAIPFPEKMASWMRSMEDQSELILRLLTVDHSTQTLLLNLFALALVPAVCEEFMFQGTIQAFLTKWSAKPHLAIWVTAVVFSAIHLQFYGFIPRLLLGAYLGYLFYWSGSLWLPILAHFLHNALTVLVDYTFQGRGIDLSNMRFSDVHGAMPILIGCALVTAMSLVFMWRVQRDVKEGALKKR